MRLADVPIVPLSEAFGRLGLALCHKRDNTFLLVGPGGGEVTSWQFGEALARGESFDEAAAKIMAALKPPPAPEPEVKKPAKAREFVPHKET